MQHVVIERSPTRGGHEPVGPDHGNLRERAHGRGPGGGRVFEDAVGVFLEDAVPDGRIPDVPAKIDSEQRLLRVDGHRVHDLRAPRQAVDQLVERIAIRLQFLVGEAGVVQVSEREVALEAAGAAVHRFEISQDEVIGLAGADGGAGRRGFGSGGTRRDPALDDLLFLGSGSNLLAHRGHGAVVDSPPEPARGRVLGHDLLAGHELRQIGDVVHAALDRTVLPVAAIAVRLENRLGLGRELLVVVCERQLRLRHTDHSQRGKEEVPGGHRVRPQFSG
ncbi:MAG: hypothetical protein U0792_20470 [Gemmataceae bacterium]